MFFTYPSFCIRIILVCIFIRLLRALVRQFYGLHRIGSIELSNNQGVFGSVPRHRCINLFDCDVMVRLTSRSFFSLAHQPIRVVLHPALRALLPDVSGTRSYGSFFILRQLRSFMKIYGKILWRGGHQSGTVIFCYCLQKNHNCGQYKKSSLQKQSNG